MALYSSWRQTLADDVFAMILVILVQTAFGHVLTLLPLAWKPVSVGEFKVGNGKVGKLR